MKRLLLLLSILAPLALSAQTVENIRVEPDGEYIKITYRIGGSTESQLYNVSLDCSMDGLQRFAPQTIEGDVGQNIRGGKSIYTILWDVFEDVEEVGEVEFFVKVDLVSDDKVSARRTFAGEVDSTTLNQPEKPVENQESTQAQPASQQPAKAAVSESVSSSDRKISKVSYIGYSGGPISPIGVSFGSLKSIGSYLSFRAGTTEVVYHYYESGVYVGSYPWDLVWFTPSIGLTKSLVALNEFRVHAYAGVGYSFIFAKTESDDTANYKYVSIEGGLIAVYKAFYLSGGVEYRYNKDIGNIPILNLSNLHKPAFILGAGLMF